MTKLPSDKLKERRHPWRALAIVSATLLVLAGLFGVGWFTIANYSSNDIRVSALAHEKSQIDHKLLVPHQLKSEVPTPPPPAPENFYGNSGPVQCPAGTAPNAVDEYGNESNCQATNGGQPCVEYNDANECVAWYQP